jgi:hypothetical protein|tara:strand:+ start:67 stop:192 length:126 start_codon:yes stop_codon:yes gene_type:complete
MEEPKIACVQLVEPGENPAVVLDLADETLDKMALSVTMRIV